MSSARITAAMDRIDRALARIETQAALAGHGPASAAVGDSDLAARHEALRDAVSGSLAELDTLIAGLER